MKLSIEIDLPKRTIDAIIQYCEINKLTLVEYISDCVAKQNNIDRYGDLNTLIIKNKETVDGNMAKADEKKTVVMNDAITVPTSDTVPRMEKENVIRQEAITNTDSDAAKPKNKTRRTLKSK